MPDILLHFSNTGGGGAYVEVEDENEDEDEVDGEPEVEGNIRMDFSRHSIALLQQLGLWKLFDSDKFRLLGLGKLPNIVRASLVNTLFIALQDSIFSFIFCEIYDFVFFCGKNQMASSVT